MQEVLLNGLSFFIGFLDGPYVFLDLFDQFQPQIKVEGEGEKSAGHAGGTLPRVPAS